MANLLQLISVLRVQRSGELGSIQEDRHKVEQLHFLWNSSTFCGIATIPEFGRQISLACLLEIKFHENNIKAWQIFFNYKQVAMKMNGWAVIISWAKKIQQNSWSQLIHVNLLNTAEPHDISDTDLNWSFSANLNILRMCDLNILMLFICSINVILYWTSWPVNYKPVTPSIYQVVIGFDSRLHGLTGRLA